MLNLLEEDRWAWLTRRGALRVPQIAAYFWAVKGLSTAMGETPAARARRKHGHSANSPALCEPTSVVWESL